ncbi:shikimate dehydrogenase [Halovivax limisalsi]|uniref:shikimate dehydrogenase n=1 Tax=Halovivax limisalsi TaxID=1453760 RepID=UPI001FFDA52C|nr:shikimate dehydrogenase [Halovivax limisalsi]
MDVYGLVGNPVEHSLSPPMHEAAYEARGLDARYVTFEPQPETLERAIDGADALGVRGLNVTIPFKRDALDLVEPDDLADRIGAVNTIDFGGDRPTGHNTDAVGAVRALSEHGFDGDETAIDGATAVVAGAGGAGRAIAFGLADAGATVRIANRTTSRAESLADAVPAATGHSLSELPALVKEASILVNATSVGLDEDESIVDPTALRADLVVMDAVYSPIETRLLEAAAARGARTVDGAWMLLYQGAAAFERWTGLDAPVDPMNDALRARL